MTLYLKYRPQTISELDLTSVRESLQKIVQSKNIPHAFLFAGPKGTGKTSAARILAKVINCEKLGKEEKLNKGLIEPCNKCEQCMATARGNNLDVVELDAASNRGIDDIRTLKESIILSPAKSRKKIYIIDEAHMLTTEASNAFLKTLEEPPDHVVFILATTNPEKLPATVRSRLTEVVFRKAGQVEVKRQLVRVLKSEKIKASDEVLNFIVKSSDGSFRDAVKILEQLIVLGGKEISMETVNQEFFGGKVREFSQLLESISQKNTSQIVTIIEELILSGVSVKTILETILNEVHQCLLTEVGLNEKEKILNLSRNDLFELSNALSMPYILEGTISQLNLEIALVKWSQKEIDEDTKNQAVLTKDSQKIAKEIKKKPESEVKEEVKKKEEKPQIKAVLDTSAVNEEVWKKILSLVRSRNVTVEALLRASKPLGLKEDNFMIGVYYQFHKERLEILTNKAALEKTIEEILGREKIMVHYELIEREAKPIENKNMANLTTQVNPDILEAAKEIFGS